MEVSNADRRLTYMNAKALCKEAGIDVTNANPAYGFLRLEVPIRSGQTNYEFPVLEQQTYNGNVQLPTEKRLQLQDNFVVGSKGFFMYFYNTTTGKPISDLLTYISIYNLPAGYAKGNRTWLPSGINQATMPGANNAFWQDAWMKYTMNYKVLIPRYDLLQHWDIPQTQAQFNTIDNAGTPPLPADSWQYPWTFDQRDGLSSGFIPMEPNIVLSGAKNTEINYYLPYPLDFADLGWINADIINGVLQPRLVCMYRGILLQNTTNVN